MCIYVYSIDFQMWRALSTSPGCFNWRGDFGCFLSTCCFRRFAALLLPLLLRALLLLLRVLLVLRLALAACEQLVSCPCVCYCVTAASFYCLYRAAALLMLLQQRQH